MQRCTLALNPDAVPAKFSRSARHAATVSARLFPAALGSLASTLLRGSRLAPVLAAVIALPTCMPGSATNSILGLRIARIIGSKSGRQ